MDLKKQAPFLANYGQLLLALIAVGISLYALLNRRKDRSGEKHEEKLRRIDEDNYIMQDTTSRYIFNSDVFVKQTISCYRPRQ